VVLDGDEKACPAGVFIDAAGDAEREQEAGGENKEERTRSACAFSEQAPTQGDTTCMSEAL